MFAALIPLSDVRQTAVNGNDWKIYFKLVKEDVLYGKKHISSFKKKLFLTVDTEMIIKNK